MNATEKDYLNFAETKSEKRRQARTAAPSSSPRGWVHVCVREIGIGLIEDTNDCTIARSIAFKRQAVRSLGPLRSPVTRRPRVVYLPGRLPGILTALHRQWED